jgi:exodeoxyribonuclease VII large subunit
LEAEGLFDPSRKRLIPRYPRQIGIVTSPTGAALQDILNTLRRRYPAVEVILAPSPVQGDEAQLALISSIEKLNHIIHPDVIILARGGGSIEDLWAFNDERLAYAICASEAPIICGVGHETDFTIADFVCDLRAPTPTAAAELAVPNRLDLQASLSETCNNLIRGIQEITSTDILQIERLQNRLNQRSPAHVIRANKQQIDDLIGRIDRTTFHKIEIRKLEFSGIQQHLVSISPMTILGRGYAVVTHADGNLIRTIAQVQPGNNIEIRVQDGKFPATVQNGA